ncbi:PopZ family protein [Roseibium sp.]|uniref:PopZ family protein n=1 Tax=Roseibium sp. TaxID=1936156 RepID=UPI003A98643F
MAQASQAEEPSMEEILASIRRIISDEDTQTNEGEASDADASLEDNPVEIEAADDMGDASEMSQDDLDKLFDMDDGGGDDVAEAEADDDMAAAMAEEAAAEEIAVEEPVVEEPEPVEEDDAFELTEDLELSEDDVTAIDEPMEMVGGMPDNLAAEDSDVAFLEEEPVPDMAAAMPDIPPPPPPAPPKSTIATTPVPDNDLPDVEADAPLTSSNTGEQVHAAFDSLSNLFVGSQAQTVEELVKDMLRPMLKAWLDQNLPGMVEQMVKKEIDRVTRGR